MKTIAALREAGWPELMLSWMEMNEDLRWDVGDSAKPKRLGIREIPSEAMVVTIFGVPYKRTIRTHKYFGVHVPELGTSDRSSEGSGYDIYCWRKPQ